MARDDGAPTRCWCGPRMRNSITSRHSGNPGGVGQRQRVMNRAVSLVALSLIGAVTAGCGPGRPSSLAERPRFSSTTETGSAPNTTVLMAKGPPSCPAAVGWSDSIGNIDAPTGRLVPSEPLVGRLCRYWPLYGPSRPGYPHGRLEGEAKLDEPAARSIAALLNSIPQDTQFPHTCPADFGSVDLVIFGFASQPTLTVRASASGCPHFTNGSLVTGRWSPPFEQYSRLIDALLPRADQLT
jgi:hypothetical protein